MKRKKYGFMSMLLCLILVSTSLFTGKSVLADEVKTDSITEMRRFIQVKEKDIFEAGREISKYYNRR